ncbi:hypothetical protein F511_34155 [Dorcoceras hygrometricum]|uniref:Uncharacterized protein n=1 Tax=Dorcoceras hygrometricum TaxID=472368 RepID=A0A2Z7A7S7_9LAMI|nr:hypothetical protein F511_34155 [Dorcoceras hygrometricum]
MKREHCDVLSMQMDSDLVIYQTTLVRTFQVVTICRVDKSEALSGSRTSILPPPILNKLSLISMRELKNQYLCDPQWFRDTASRGLTTFVTPKSHFRTNPSDHGKASSNIAP